MTLDKMQQEYTDKPIVSVDNFKWGKEGIDLMSGVDNGTPAQFQHSYNWLASRARRAAERNGHLTEQTTIEQMIQAVVDELEEWRDAYIAGSPPDEHLPHLSSSNVELADAIITIMSCANHLNLNLADAIVQKIRYNEIR